MVKMRVPHLHLRAPYLCNTPKNYPISLTVGQIYLIYLNSPSYICGQLTEKNGIWSKRIASFHQRSYLYDTSAHQLSTFLYLYHTSAHQLSTFFTCFRLDKLIHFYTYILDTYKGYSNGSLAHSIKRRGCFQIKFCHNNYSNFIYIR